MKAYEKKYVVVAILLLVGFAVHAQPSSDNENGVKGKHFIGAGPNAGLVVGDFSNNYDSTLGLDVFYMYGISKKFLIGGSTGFANYFSDEPLVRDGIQQEAESLQFIPLTASIRSVRFKYLVVGTDIGYAFGLNEGNDGGFYLSSRITHFIGDKVPVFFGYRRISYGGDNLDSFLIGVGIKF